MFYFFSTSGQSSLITSRVQGGLLIYYFHVWMRWRKRPHQTARSFRMASARRCCSLTSQTESCLKCLVGCPHCLHQGDNRYASMVTVATPPPPASVSCFFFFICIQNKQEIVFICMQMCLSLRLGFWIKSFTVPLIPNYTPALTSPPPLDVGVFNSASKCSSVGLGCLVCHLRNRVGIWI